METSRASLAQPLERRALADHAYERLKELVLNHRVKPGTWMTIDVLARDLGVSPTPVREALARLESDGLVRKNENGRYRAEPLLTLSAFESLYEVRLLLEPFAASLAAKHITDTEIVLLKEAEASMQTAPTGRIYAQFARFTQADAAFHDVISKACRNQYLYDAIYRLHSHARLAHLYLNHGIIDAESAIGEHAEIVSMIVARHSRGVQKAMRRHIERSRDQLRELISEGQSASERTLNSK